MLTPEELKIAERAKEMGKSPEEALVGIQKYRASQKMATSTEPTANTGTTQTTKDLGIGFAKGIGSTVQSTGRAIQKGISSLGQAAFGENNPYVLSESVIDKNMDASNTTQKVGKAGEFLFEVLFPTGLAAKGTKLAGASLKGLGSRISAIGDDAVEGGVKVKDKLVDLFANLDDKTKTALTRTPIEVFTDFVEKGRNALIDDRNRTPLESVGDTIIDGLSKVKEQASNIGKRKQQLLESISQDKTLDLRSIGAGKGDLFVPNELGAKINKTIKSLDEQFNKMSLDKGDANLISEFKQKIEQLGKNPSLAKLDATIDMLQEKLYTSSRNNAVEVTDRVTGMLRKVLGELNGAVKEKAGTEYQQLNAEYADAITLVNELNARLGKEGASAGAFVKRLFSPSDARTKELFEQLQKYTGQDYFRDARLAKFVMEALGDARASSLLEQIPTSAMGVLEKGLQYIGKKVSDPIKAAELFIKNQ